MSGSIFCANFARAAQGYTLVGAGARGRNRIHCLSSLGEGLSLGNGTSFGQLTIVGGDRERPVVTRPGRGKTVCASRYTRRTLPGQCPPNKEGEATGVSRDVLVHSSVLHDDFKVLRGVGD